MMRYQMVVAQQSFEIIEPTRLGRTLTRYFIIDTADRNPGGLDYVSAAELASVHLVISHFGRIVEDTVILEFAQEALARWNKNPEPLPNGV